MADRSQVPAIEALKAMIAAASSADVAAMLIEILDSFYRGDPAAVALARRRFTALAETGYDLDFRGSIPGDTAVIGHGIVSYDPRSPYFIHRPLMLAAAQALGLPARGFDQNQLSDMDAFWRAYPRAPLSNEAQVLLPEVDPHGVLEMLSRYADDPSRPSRGYAEFFLEDEASNVNPEANPLFGAGTYNQETGAFSGLPVSGKVTDGFDAHGGRGEAGAVDIVDNEHFEIRAPAGGFVAFVLEARDHLPRPEDRPDLPPHQVRDPQSISGATVVVVNHGNGWTTTYRHLRQRGTPTDPILVRAGQRVWRGDLLGNVGRTGTRDPHLHLELRKDGVAVDPLLYLQSWSRLVS